jgi:glycosyltransferase 2 family protein
MKVLKISVSLVLFAWLAWRTDWQQVGAAFGQLDLGLWLAALGIYGVAQLLSCIRWRMLSRPLGFEQPLSYFLGYYFIGMFFNLLLPTSVGGDVVRAWYLDDHSGRRLPAFVSVFVERCSGLVVLLTLACGADLFCPIALPAWVSWSVWSTLGALGLAGGGAWLYCGLQSADCGLEIHRTDSRPGRCQVLQSAICTLQSAITERPGLLISTTLLSLGVQAANVVLVWLVGLAIGAPIPASYYWIVVPMVSLMQVVLPSLNGHGVREGGLILFLAEVGVSQGTAVSLGFLWFSVMATASLAGGLVYLFGRFPRPEVHSDHDEPVGNYSDQGRARQPAAAA